MNLTKKELNDLSKALNIADEKGYGVKDVYRYKLICKDYTINKKGEEVDDSDWQYIFKEYLPKDILKKISDGSFGISSSEVNNFFSKYFGVEVNLRRTGQVPIIIDFYIRSTKKAQLELDFGD